MKFKRGDRVKLVSDSQIKGTVLGYITSVSTTGVIFNPWESIIFKSDDDINYTCCSLISEKYVCLIKEG